MSLLDRLKSVGEYDSTGEFTLDEEKARQKLARFQLTDPRRFVLELVMAAVRLGVRELLVDTTPELKLTWSEPHFAAEALEDFDRFLLEGPSAERHLAIALNAVQQLRPRRVTVASRAGVALVDGRVGRSRVPDNRIEVEGVPDLAELVREECGHGGAAVVLNGVRLTPQLEWAGPTLQAQRGSLHVTVGLHPSLASSELLLVYQGVVVARPKPSLGLPLLARVLGDDFTLNASHSDVVQDDRFQEALKLVEETGRRCLERLVANYHAEDGLTEFLRSQLRSHHRGTRWWDLPVFPLLDGKLASARVLEKQCEKLGLVPVCRTAPPGTPPDILLVRAEAAVEGVLRRLFGEKVGPGDEHVLNRLQADANRRAWEGRPRDPVLKLGRWLARAPVEGRQYRGEVGLEAQDGPREAVLTVLYQGRQLSVERLEAPLPYVAVLDFDELELRSDWSGPVPSRLYNEAVDKLTQTAERLYLQLSEADIDGSLTGVREGLLVMLSAAKGGRLKHFWRARLFALATGGAVSLAALEEAHARGEPLYLLPKGATLPKLPREALPPGVILSAHPQGDVILHKALGKRVRPFGQLDQLAELARRLRERKAARLGMASSVPLEGMAGELALLPSPGPGSLEVLREGVSLGTRAVPSAGTSFVAIVDCPRLTPQASYQGPVADSVWQEVLAVVAEAERRALASLGEHPPPDSAWNPVLLKLLESHPTPALERRELFPAQPHSVSLRQVREQFQSQGHVLVAAPGELQGVTPDRWVLLEGSRALLDRLVPGLVWEKCGQRLRREQAERSFMARPPVPAVRVGGKLREGLEPPFTGEVALAPGGDVTLYHLNRAIARPEWLPQPLRGAVQSPDFRPLPDFTGLEPDSAWNAAREAVLRAASRLIGKAAAAGAKLPLATWVVLAAWEGLAPDDRALVWAMPFLPRAGGGKLSLAETDGYYLNAVVGPVPQRPVLLLKPEEVDLLGGLVKLVSYHPQHYKDGLLAARHKRLARLPTRLGPTFVEMPFDEVSLVGTLGIPRKLQREVVLLQDGGAVAWHEPSMPLAGVLAGHFDLTRLEERTELGKEQRKRLATAAHKLYARLAEQFDFTLHRATMLEYLRTEWRTAQDSAVARLPLFRCWQGTASLAALLEEAEREGELICLERGVRPPAADSRLYPLLETELLSAIFANRLRLVRRPRWGEGVGAALRAAGTAVGGGLWNVARGLVTPGWQRLERLAGKLAGLVEGTAAEGPAPARAAAPAVREKDTPERRLLGAVRRHFYLSVQNPARKLSRSIVERMCWRKHILGPPCWWDSDGTLCLNLNDASMRYAMEHQEDDPAVVQMLLVHVFCVINRRLEEVTDEHEEDFLRDLGVSLAQAFEAAESAAV